MFNFSFKNLARSAKKLPDAGQGAKWGNFLKNHSDVQIRSQKCAVSGSVRVSRGCAAVPHAAGRNSLPFPPRCNVKDCTATVWNRVRRYIIKDGHSVSIQRRVVLQMLPLCVIPVPGDHRVVALLPCIEIAGILIAYPFGVGRHIAPRHFKSVRFCLVSKGQPQPPQSCRRTVSTATTVMLNALIGNPACIRPKPSTGFHVPSCSS